MTEIFEPQMLDQVAALLLRADAEIVMPGLANSATAMTAKGMVYGETDYVTQIDTDSEAFLLQHLVQILPAFATGEESYDSDPDARAKMQQGYAWIVDPLDGTNNVKKFIAGENTSAPNYGIMAALLLDGKPIAGWILASMAGHKMLAMGAPGHGAWLQDLPSGTRQPITLPPFDIADAATAPVVTTLTAWPNKIAPHYGDLLNERLTAGLWTVAASVPKSAAVEAMMMLRGQATAAIWRQFRAWDHMAPAVITEAAGGVTELLQAARPLTIDAQRQDGVLAAPSAAALKAFRTAIMGDTPYTRTEDPK